ncbi:MAG: DUF4139 domain-containing protein [Armatimonadota bacterium]
MTRFLICATLILAAAASLAADVDLTMVPDREAVEMVVYGNQDLTLVRDRRTIGFQEGANNIEFTWADTQIDPTSIKIRAVRAPDKILIQQASYPPHRKNTLVWTIECLEAGEYLVEVSYFTSGISWSPHYRVIANDDESRVTVLGAIELQNRSGEDYEQAQAKLVVGDLHVVQQIAELAQQDISEQVSLGLVGDRLFAGKAVAVPARRAAAGRVAAVEEAGGEAEEAPDIGMAGIGEYFIYTIEGTHDVNDGWRNRFAAISGQAVPISVLHKYDPNRWGEVVRKFYVFRNDEDSNLGATPLAKGVAYALRDRTKASLIPVATTQMPYSPIGEKVELDVGNDPLVIVERKLMDYKKLELTFNQYKRLSGWDTEEQYRVEVRNRSEKPIQIEVFENIGGIWVIETDEPYEKMSTNQVKFTLDLPGQGSQTIEFKISKHFGKNAEGMTNL